MAFAVRRPAGAVLAPGGVVQRATGARTQSPVRAVRGQPRHTKSLSVCGHNASGTPAASRPARTCSGRMAAPTASTKSAGVPASLASMQEERGAAVRAVQLAAILTANVQRRLASSETLSKDDASPVTVADYGSQVLVAWALQKQLGVQGFSMVAEEDSTDLTSKEGGPAMLTRLTQLVNESIEEACSMGLLTPQDGQVLAEEDVVALIDQGDSQGGKEGRHWVLDPIDGTRGFVRGDQYAIALGRLHEGKVVMGVLGCPNLPMTDDAGTSNDPDAVGSLFVATQGEGTYIRHIGEATASQLDPSSTWARVTTNPLVAIEDAVFCESYESRHSDHTLTERVKVAAGASSVLRMDSQAKYGVLSRGGSDVYMRFPPKGYVEKIWDHAAGMICVTEAGGMVTDAQGNELDFSEGRFLRSMKQGIVATGNSVHHAPILRFILQNSA